MQHSSRSCLAVVSAIFLALGTAFSSAATDNYSTGPGQGAPDGMCDVWQILFNAWGLSQSGDEDFDGCSNSVESIAGTNPFLAGDCTKVGNMAIAAGLVVFTIDAEAGKKYRILSSDSPASTATWTGETLVAPAPGPHHIPTADNAALNLSVVKAPDAKKFYRLEVSDNDQDGDGVSDWAEYETGTNPGLATSPGNASGGAATDGATMASLLSLTIAPFNGQDSAFEKEGTNAVLRLSRTGTMPLNNIPLAFAGDADDTKGSALPADYSLKDQNNVTVTTTISIPNLASTWDLQVVPAGAGNTNGDGSNEVPETLKVTCSLPGVPGGAGPSNSVKIKDATVVDANRKLFVAYLGREAGVTSTASGIATALVNGDNDTASVSITFSNLSSNQTGGDTYIRIGSDLEVKQVPDGQVAGASWPIRAAQFVTTDQAMLTSLFTGQLFLEIRTDEYPTGEIKGYFNPASGSTTFDENNPDLVEPATGSANYTTTSNDQIERDIWRFMSQCTWGGTTVLYNQIRAKVDARIALLGGSPTSQQLTDAYLQGLDDWLTEQMNPGLTPTINFRTLVMAADNEDFALRGNKPIHYFNDPQYLGTGFPVTYDAAGNPVINPTANNNQMGGNYPQSGPNRRREWWGMVLQCKDQVRQRFTQALSEILVISEADQTLLDRHYGTAHFWDMLAAGAFGKFRPLLEQVTYSPIMGVYLSHIQNRAEYDAGGGIFVKPDENYAREIMQLFSIGLILRHPDGSLVLGGDGLPIATYDQNDIVELARVMTGWSSGARHVGAYTSTWNGTVWNHSTFQNVGQEIQLNGESATNTWWGRQDGHLYWAAPWTNPMKLIGRIGATTYHDFGQKTLLAGKVQETDVPAQTITAMTDTQTHAAAVTDMTIAHNCLAGDQTSNTSYNGHPNTPVNISRWLIQRLVTSNPSAGYIYRVSEAYRDTNGNLGAVLKAILLDYEARSLQFADSSISHGKVKEPLVAFAQMLRGLRAFSGAPISILKDNPPPFSATDSPMPDAYPAGEFNKFSTDNANPPSLPTGWATGPFRYRFGDLTGNISQSPQRPPSVFNWFLPDYVVPGAMAEAGLFAPEMQIETESSEVNKINYFYAYTWSNLTGMSTQPGQDSNVADFQLFNNWATPAAYFTVNGVRTNTLTFTAANYNVDQVVTVTSVDNVSLGSLTNGVLRFTVSGGGYDSVTPPALPLTVQDNDKPNEGVLVTPTGTNTWVQEGGKTDTVNVRLASPPVADVTITANVAGAQAQVSSGAGSPGTSTVLTFTPANWNTDQAITVTAVNDGTTEAAGTNNDTISFTTVSTAANYNGLTVPSVAVGVVDNNDGASSQNVLISSTAELSVTETGNTSGTGTASYTIVLTRAPSASVTVNITSVNSNITVNTTNGGTTFGTTGSRTFTTSGGSIWSTPQTVIVRGNDDGTAEGSWPANPLHAGLINHSISATAGGYSLTIPIQPVFATVQDNDNRIILTHLGNNETRVMEGGSVPDTINVRLRTAPLNGANVFVNLGSNQLKCDPAFLTFTPANYNVDQLVSVTAVDDDDREGIMSSWALNKVSVNATAMASFPTTLSSLTITNGGSGYSTTPTVSFTGGGGAGAAATATVTGGVVTRLTITNVGVGYTSAPTVAFAGGGGSGAAATAAVAAGTAGTISSIAVNDPGSGYTYPPNVTFGNFAAATAVRTGNVVTSITVNNGGGGYTAAPAITITGGNGSGATATANITNGVISSITVTNGGSGYTSNPTVNFVHPGSGLAAIAQLSPTGTVTSVSITAAGSGYICPPSVFINPPPSSPSVIIANAYSDNLADTSYNNYWSATHSGIQVSVLDNDNSGVTVAQTGGSTTPGEDGSTDIINYSLTQQPTANVTVNLITTTQFTATPSSLTFTPANWNTVQPVTIAAVDDTTVEGNQPAILSYVVDSSDSAYDGVQVLPTTVTVIDNDRLGLTITQRNGFTGVAEGGTAGTAGTPNVSDTVLVRLARTPTANVTVTLLTDGQVTVSPSVLNFTAANAGTDQTVTITAVDDGALEVTPHISNIKFQIASTDVYYNGSPLLPLPVQVKDNDGPGFSIVENGGIDFTLQTGGNTTPTEGGTDSVTVVLTKQPSNNVVINVASLNTADVTVTTPATGILTFTNANWNTPQTVTFTALYDGIIEGRELVNATFTVNAASTLDDTFDSVPVQTQQVWVLDQPRRNESLVVAANGGAGFVESSGNFYVSESGKTDAMQVYLSAPPAGNVLVTLDANSQLGFDCNSLLFSPTDWNVPRTVTVHALDDSPSSTTTSVENNHTSNAQWRSNQPNGVLFPGSPLWTFTNPTTTYNIVDNDGIGVLIEESGGATATVEGGTGGANQDTYTIRLAKAPNGNVAISATTASAANGQTVSPTTLTFTTANWNTPQTVTVTVANDATVETSLPLTHLHTSNITHAIVAGSTTDTTGYAALTGLQTVVNFITDNDNRIIVTPSGIDTRVHENGTVNDTYTVVLRQLPTANVTVNVSVPANQGIAAVSPLTFTTANWNVPQTVNLTGLNNGISAERVHTTDITHTSSSTDSFYNAQTIPAVRANVLVIDTPQVIVIENGNTTFFTESGGTDTYFIGLSQPPTADVTVTIVPDSQVAVANNGPTVLTFTPANWDTMQTVTLRAVDDLVPEGDLNTAHLGIVAHTAASTDSAFNGIAVAQVPCFITDNDLPQVLITPSGGSTLIAEGGANDTYDVVLNSNPTADVTVTITHDADIAAPASTTLTFNPTGGANPWNVPQTVVVQAADDADVENTHTGALTHAVTSADLGYHQSSVPSVVASISDNDGPQLVLTETSGGTSIVEGGSTDTFNIKLSSLPTGSVTITLVAPNIIIPTPAYGKNVGYFSSDIANGNLQKDRIVMDYTELNLLYRATFYGSLAVAYGGSGNIPPQPGNTQLQNAHWAACKALVDKLDIWWCGGSLKARFPDLIEPNQPPPVPLPGPNPRQVVLECIYQIDGGANSLGTTRYLPEIVFDPKNPPNLTFHNEIRDRCRWAGYLMSTVVPGMVAH